LPTTQKGKMQRKPKVIGNDFDILSFDEEVKGEP
jgi:hypothetical protein